MKTPNPFSGVRFLFSVVLLAALIASSVSFPQGVQAQGLSFPAEINKEFSPISITPGGISRLAITIFNPNSFPLANAAWVDNLIGVQPGIFLATPVNLTNTCGGTVVAPAGGTSLSLSGGTVPAQVGVTPGSCTISVDVTSNTPGNLINTIPAGGLTGTGGGGTITNTTPASATLRVGSVQPPLIGKLFTPNTMWVGQTSQLSIAINNVDPNTALTQTTFTDNLPAGVILANPVAATLNGCGATATLTGASGAGSFTLNNATIAPGAVCLITVNVTSTTAGTYTNTIPPGAIQTDQGVTNQGPAIAPLNVQGVGLSKSFSPPNFEAGGTTTLTITLQNPTGSALTGVNIADTLPGTVLTVVPGSAATTCGGTASTTLPRTVTLTGGTIPAGSPTTPGTCTITVQVTAPLGATADTFTNTIPAGAMTTTQGITNVLPASAPVTIYTAGAGVGAQKSFVPATIQPGENSRLTITITAPADSNLTNFSLVDNLPANVTISNSTAPSVSASCGASAVLTAVTGGTNISLTNGTILAGATCQIDVYVTSSVAGVYTNTINPANVSSAEGQTLPGPITADLTVQSISNLAVSKLFTPDTVAPNGISLLTISLTNTNSSPLINVSLLDNLPGDTVNGVVVAPVPNATTTCGSGVVTAVPGTQVISMAGGTIPAQSGGVPGLCTITLNVQGRGSGTGFNTIPTANVSGTIQGTSTVINPIADATAPFTITDLSIGVVKEFNPLTVFGGSASTMSVELVNPNNANLVGIAFTDNMPAGMIVATPAISSVGTCGGTITAISGNGSFSFSGGNLPPFGTCTLTISITMTVNGNLTNTIPANAVTTTNGASNPQPTEASLTNLPGASVSKAFSPNPINAGDFSLLTITIQNTGNIPLTGMGLSDTLPGNLPAGLSIAGAPAPAPVNNCGGTLTAVTGSQFIQLTNGSLAASSSCTIVVAVTSTTPGSYQNIIPAGNLTSSEGATNNTPATDTLVVLGGPTTASIGDYVWYDADADGIQDASEAGIGGVTVNLYSSNGTLIGTTTTSAGGFYQFTGLTPGDYYVEFVPPAGYTVSPQDQGGNDATDSDVNPVTGQTIVTTLTAGENDLTWDAGLYQPASLGNFVWNDLDSDGVQDGGAETGIDGVTVNLYRPGYGPDGIPGNADDADIVATTTTAGGGLYLFDNLIPGDYYVDFIPPAGYVVSPQDQGGNDATDSDANPVTGQTVVTTLTPGENDLTWDAGLHQSASLGDFVWNDLDADGVQDGGPETGIDGVTVNLYDSNGTLIATTTTSGGGFYLFTDLVPGDYHVEFIPPVGYVISPQDQGGNDAADSDANPVTGQTIDTTITAGENDLTWDAGLYQPASLGDFVWNDLNANGVQDGGEAGINGVTVNLYRPGYGPDGIPGNADDGDIVATTTTAGGGLYLFDNLIPGDYYVDFIPPAGYVLSPQDQGGNDAADSDANVATGQTITTTLVSGENDLTWDAGLYQPASLGDFVWSDLNANGIQDGSAETGIDGVTVNLYRPGYGPDGIPGNADDGDIVATTTTAGGGLYLFDNLIPGDYYVDFIPPAGYVLSPQDLGGNDAADSDANPVNGQTIVTTLTPGENDLTWDAGLYQSASLGDFVWNDLDADGVQDAGETGIDGVTVNLYSSNGTLIGTTTTSGGGLYLFTDLTPGDYYVEFIPPAGYVVSPQDQGGNDATDSDVNPVNGQTIVTTITAGENDLTWDAGLYQPASLGDYVWNDTNANGVQDGGETGIDGVTVNLYSGNGTLIATTTTAGGGLYLFDNLVPGDYYVEFIPPAGYVFSPQDQGGNNATDSDANTTNGRTVVTTLTAGENDLTWDAGLFQQQNPTGLTKSITGTSLPSTTGTNTAIGEIVTYQVVVTVLPGTYANATLVDTMERGLAFVACDSINAPGLTTDVAAGSFASICSNPATSDAGGGTTVDVDRRVTYNFGTLTNAGLTDATITITYRAIVLDVAVNIDGNVLNNSVTWSWTGGSIGPAQTTVTVVEPDLTISKTANVNFVANGSEVTFTLTISHTQASNSDAYDVVVTDVLPTGLSYVANTLDCTTGAQDPDIQCVVDNTNPAQPTIRAEWSVFTRAGGAGRIQFRVVGNANIPQNGNVTNTANVEWTSLPGDQTAPRSFTPNVFSTERYYDPNDTVNVYGAGSSLTLTRVGTGGGGGGGGGNNNAANQAGGFLIPLTGFAPDTVTELNSASRPVYGSTAVVVEIPSIKVNAPIVGVQLKDGDWDVSWLVNQAGWLEGTAYPTWNGNSVLTAHVVNADGKPGLFARLDKVRTGDYIFLYQSGYRYTYQIVSNKYVQANDITVLKHEDKATITLITCDTYDEKTGTYLRRVAVRAVLVDVSAIK